MFWKSKTKNSGMYNTLSIPANLVTWTQNGTNWNGILTEATMLANNIDYTRVMNVVPQWSQATNGNGWVTTISRSSADNNIYITLTRGSGGSSANAVTLDTQQTITGTKTFNALPQSSVTPTNANDLTNKAYVDSNKFGNTYVLIAKFSNLTNLSDSFTQKFDYTNNLNSFTIENQSSYEILIKNAGGEIDFYCSGIIGVNSANYNNMIVTSDLLVASPGDLTVKFGVILKNNQFKLLVKRSAGTGTTLTGRILIFVRKIGNGVFQE